MPDRLFVCLALEVPRDDQDGTRARSGAAARSRAHQECQAHLGYRARRFQQSVDPMEAHSCPCGADISFLVIGGGPVGVEVASQIAAEYPDKLLHIVHSKPRFVCPHACRWCALQHALSCSE